MVEIAPASGSCEVDIRGLCGTHTLKCVEQVRGNLPDPRPGRAILKSEIVGGRIFHPIVFCRSTKARGAHFWNDSNRGRASPECLPRCLVPGFRSGFDFTLL